MLRSIVAKIVAWALGTAAISLIGFLVTTRAIDGRTRGRFDMMGKTQVLQVEEAQRALDEGGPGRLDAYLRRLDDLFIAEHRLLDPRGIDLADGRDRSDLLARASRPPHPPAFSGGKLLISSPPTRAGSRLLIAIDPPMDPAGLLSYYLWILATVVGLGYALAIYLVRPLRQLRRAVDRFGRGELTARIKSTRRDEIGELAKSFDAMAERIETLLNAERRLLQDVSHELRSPLARLKFAVELARAGAEAPAALDRIARDVGRLSGLVDELLQLTRAEGDPAVRPREAVALDGLLAELIDDCRWEADAGGSVLALDADPGVTVRGDRALLRRAFENVLRNAVRHAPAGTAVDVALRGGAAVGTVTIRDRGIGVPEAALESIFEPFFRVEDDRARSSGGVGLGLAIARRALAIHRGTIAAEDAGPGLRVRVVLPLAATVAPEAASA